MMGGGKKVTFMLSRLTVALVEGLKSEEMTVKSRGPSPVPRHERHLTDGSCPDAFFK